MALNNDRTPVYITAAQVSLAAIGVAGALLHAFPLHADPAIHQNWPIVDAIDIGWLALAVIGVLLPEISEITLGGASVKLREVKEDAEQSEQELVAVTEELANLAQNWSTSAMLYIDLLDNAETDEQREMLLRHYIRDRMGEAAEFLSDDPDDEVRIMLWIYDPDSKRLEFYFSSDEPPIQQAYEQGEGLIGQAFLERRRFNEPDVRKCKAYKKSRNGDPPYRAVLCVPVSIGDEVIGMLTADKKEAEIFSTAADDLAKGLASQCALAIDQFRRRD